MTPCRRGGVNFQPPLTGTGRERALMPRVALFILVRNLSSSAHGEGAGDISSPPASVLSTILSLVPVTHLSHRGRRAPDSERHTRSRRERPEMAGVLHRSRWFLRMRVASGSVTGREPGQAGMLTEFGGLSTPLVADACIRAGVPLRVAPPGIGAVVPGQRVSGRALPTRHYGSAARRLRHHDSRSWRGYVLADAGASREAGHAVTGTGAIAVIGGILPAIRRKRLSPWTSRRATCSPLRSSRVAEPPSRICRESCVRCQPVLWIGRIGGSSMRSRSVIGPLASARTRAAAMRGHPISSAHWPSRADRVLLRGLRLPART